MLAKYDSLTIGGIKNVRILLFLVNNPFFKIIIGNEKIFDVGIVLTHSKFMTSSESFKVITLESSFLVSLVFITSTNA